jgi:hypothetical protein
VKGKRLSSGPYFDTSLDPFADDDDGFVVGKGRKRTKFARHSDSWQLLDRTPSPEEETVDLRLDEAEEGRETTALPSQPQSANGHVEPLGELPVEGAAVESRPDTASVALDDTHSLSNLSEPRHVEVHPKPPDADTGQHSQPDETRQMQPPATRPQRAPSAPDMEMEMDVIVRTEIQSLARSNQETPRLLPLQSPGLPLVSPLTTQSGLLSGYFPDMLDGHWKANASGDEQQTGTPSETKFASIDASNDKPVPSTDAGKVTLLSPDEVERPCLPEPEIFGRNELFELSSPTQELPSQPGQSLQAASRSSFHEEIQPDHVIPQEQQQAPANVDEPGFEFLNMSPLEGKTPHQDTWNLPETSASTLATVEARRDDGQRVSAEASMSVVHMLVDTAHEMPQNDAHIQSPSDELCKPKTTMPQFGEPAHTENINAVSEKPPASSATVPIDPSLLPSAEAATELIVSSNSGVQTTDEPPGQISDSRPWTDKLDVSAVGAESPTIYNAPRFPFVQSPPSSRRSRRSSQYSSFDGVSDEAPADELSGGKDMSDGSHELKALDRDKRSDEDGEASKHVLTPTPGLSSPVGDGIRDQHTFVPSNDLGFQKADVPTEGGSIVVLDSSGEDANYDARSESSVEDAIGNSAVRSPEGMVDPKAGQVSDVGKETQISTDDIHELQTDRIEGPTLPRNTARDESSSPAIRSAAPTQTGRPAEISSATGQDATVRTSRPPTELTISTQPLGAVPPQKLQYQLVTPESTQQESGDQQLQDHSVELGREVSPPPTPQNTQEYADEPQPTAELPITADAGSKVAQTLRMPLSTGVNVGHERRRSPRLSRKFPASQDATEAVNPYFTPRRTSQMRAQDQSTTVHKSPLAKPSQGLANDTIQMTEETKATEVAVAGEEVTLGSPIKDPLDVGITTSTSYYTPLSALQDHFSQSVDILAISTTESTEPQRAKSGPRDWHTTLHITDSSLSGNKTIIAQIFRSYKTALPKVQRGNVVLLRNFKVQSQKRKWLLLSTESSAWAVFLVPSEMGGEACEIGVEVVGPPVEYGPEENGHIIELGKWWKAEGEDRHPIQPQASHATQFVPAAKNGDDGEVTHELRDGTVYRDSKDTKEHVGVSRRYHELRDDTLYGDEPKTAPPERDATSNQNDDKAVIHELRDGTLYQDATPPRPPRDGQRRSTVTPGEKPLKNESTKTIEADVSEQADQTTNTAGEYAGNTVEGEADSGEESSTNEAVSSQIFHELRSGQRYTDPTPTQAHTKQLDQQGVQGEGDKSVVHELRDGVTYTDD